LTALYIILAILILILILPVGVSGGYDFGDVSLKVVAGPVKIQLLPKKEKKKDKPKKVKKAKKPKKEKAKKKLPPFTLELITEYVRLLTGVLNRFRKKLSIDHLRIWYLAAADDPYDAAVSYGRANAAILALIEALNLAFNIKEQDVRLRVDFTEDKPQFAVTGQLTIRIGQILLIVLIAAFQFLKVFMKQKKLQKIKAERIDENGEASHRRNDGDHNVEDQGNGGRKHHSGHAHNNA